MVIIERTRLLGLGGAGARRLVVGVSGRVPRCGAGVARDRERGMSRGSVVLCELEGESNWGFGARCEGFGPGAGRDVGGGFVKASNWDRREETPFGGDAFQRRLAS